MIRRWAGFGLVAINGVLAAMIVAGLVGQWVRDRAVVFALMMYLPLLPIGLIAVIVDLAQRGRAIRRVRFALAGLGLIGATVAVADMSGGRAIDDGGANLLRAPAVAAQRAPVRLLQWNVWWGGPPDQRNERTWNLMIDEIRSRWPDIVVLSEAPGKAKLAQLTSAMGAAGWSFVNRRQDEEGGADRVAVLSRWPLDKEKTFDFRNGGGVIVRVDHPERPLRILAVDGLSDPLILRTALLDDVAAKCRELESAGRRVDFIAGDFNAISRSIGFDPFDTMCGGYSLASRAASEWRATYRAGFPLYDIDHVWVHRSLTLHDCEFFTNLASNHRGQIVRFSISGPHMDANGSAAGSANDSGDGSSDLRELKRLAQLTLERRAKVGM